LISELSFGSSAR